MRREMKKYFVVLLGIIALFAFTNSAAAEEMDVLNSSGEVQIAEPSGTEEAFEKMTEGEQDHVDSEPEQLSGENLQEESETETTETSVEIEMIPQEEMTVEEPSVEMQDEDVQNGPVLESVETVEDDAELIEEETADAEEYDSIISLLSPFTYSVSAEEATITGYTGNSSSVNIPSSINGYRVVAIDNYVFENCTMTSLTIPSTITSIGYHAFYNCTKLSNINFNAINCNDCSTSGVFYNAGASAASLKVTFGNGVKRIPANLFYSDSPDYYARVSTVVMSDSIQEIGNAAFTYCYNLDSVTWGSGIVEIGSYAFEECINLTSVTIPPTTTSIGYNAFYDCRRLSNINFNASNCSNCNAGLFYNAGALAPSLNVTFGNGVKRIPAELFYSHESYNYGDNPYTHITSVTLSGTIQEIDRYAFANCYDLNNVVWGNGIVTIGTCAFSQCINLSAVVIPAGTKDIGYHAFYNCKSISSITYNAVNCNGCSGDSVFYNAGASSANLPVTVGAGVKTIPDYLFYVNEDYNYGDGYYAHITSVTLPNSVLEIGSGSFANCYDLTTVTVNSKSTVFSDSAFDGCSSRLAFRCHPGSTAQTYAAKNGFKCTYLSAATSTGQTSVKVSLKKMKMPAAKSTKKKQITVTWKKMSGVTGYQIQYSTSKKFKKNVRYKTIGNASKKKITLKGMKRKKTYYVRIRSYKVSGGKTYYSKWSAKQKVKVK